MLSEGGRRIRLTKPSFEKGDLARSLMLALRIPPESIMRREGGQAPSATDGGQAAPAPAPLVIFAEHVPAPAGANRPRLAEDMRFIDDIFFEEGRLDLVRKVAEEIGITPRELEIMLLYVYSDFSMEDALGMGKSGSGEQLIAEASMHLACGDWDRLLRSSYYIYSLRNRQLAPEEARRMALDLRAETCSMSTDASYSLRFYIEACRLQAAFAPEERK